MAEAVLEGTARHVAHDEIEQLAVLAVLVDRNHGGVFDQRDGFGLAAEAFAVLRIGAEVLGQHFDRHLALEAGVLPEIHNRHPAGPELLENLVPSDFLRRHGTIILQMF